MFAATVRGMITHKLRLALTTLSIALGVAFVAGTLILTDTMTLAFDQLFGKVSKGTDAVVRQEAAYKSANASRGPISDKVLDQVRRVDGVRAAEGAISGYALMLDKDGKAINSAPSTPTLGANLPKDKVLSGDIEVHSGHAPVGPREVVIDANSAEKHHVALGSTIKVLFHGPTRQFTVVGTATFGGEKSFGGMTTAFFDTATAQQVLGTPGTFEEIHVSAAPGVSQTELTKRIRAAIPEDAEALTGKAVTKETSDDIKEGLGLINKMFLVFAGVALFVGSFIIWNTFTMIVSQRSREIALLRAVGATRRQIMRNLLTEAILLGLGASVVGIGLGVGVAKGLSALMGVVGFTLPTASTQIKPGTIWASLLVGTIVTVVASLVPARRATKVLPVEALREATPGSRPPSKKRLVIGAWTFLGGVAAMVGSLSGGANAKLLVIGLPATLIGVLTLAPVAARPLAAAIGWPLRLRGVQGDLARQNAMRNPRRTASTATALMIGLTLVVSVGVFAGSMKTWVGDTVGSSTKADLFVSRASVTGEGFSADVAKIVAGVPGVKTVSPMSYGEARFAGAGSQYSSVDPATVEDVVKLDLSSGSAKDLGDDGVLVAKSTAALHGWKVGDSVPAEFVATGKQRFHVVGIFDREDGFVESPFVISLAAQKANAGPVLHSTGLVLLDDGVNAGAEQKRIANAIDDHPDAKILTGKEFQKERAGLIDKLLIFILVMLALAVVIALLGIVNTLALSVFERTRELGLLRAVGMTRAQVRAMVRWESVVISLIGALAGAALGLGLGVALSKAALDQGIGDIPIPWSNVSLYVVAAAVAGVLAAIGPARSAAKVDVLKAVVTD
jgi:putative ABC transport system permease protein